MSGDSKMTFKANAAGQPVLVDVNPRAMSFETDSAGQPVVKGSAVASVTVPKKLQPLPPVAPKVDEKKKKEGRKPLVVKKPDQSDLDRLLVERPVRIFWQNEWLDVELTPAAASQLCEMEGCRLPSRYKTTPVASKIGPQVVHLCKSCLFLI
jgi:hypothetical protein